MSGHEERPRPWRVTLVVAAALMAWWGLTCWLAHDVHPWLIVLTDVCVALGLVWTYAGCWFVAALWSGSSPRHMFFRGLGTTLLLIVLTLIVELPAALSLVDYSELWSRLTGEWDGPATSFINDWDVGFRHPTHSKWFGQPRSDMAVYWNLPIRREAPMRFSTDGSGFRNLTDRTEADIVVLGDSYVEGAYVSDDEACAAVAERLSGLRVTNHGMAGYGTLQELEVLTRYSIPMKPRLIAWFFFEGNDLYNDTDFEGTLPILRDRRPYSSDRWNWSWHDFCERSFTRTAFRALRRVLDPIAPNSVSTCGTFRDSRGTEHRMYYYSYGAIDYDDYEKECFERTKTAFRRGRDLCRKHGIELVLFYVPMKFRVYGDLCRFPPASPCVEWRPWDLVEYFALFCEEESIPWVDLTVSMRSAALRGELLYAPEDSHWNAAGQAFVADRLLEQWQRYCTAAP